ncbi:MULTISPECIES: hypothetical protein [Alistipes]|jgi:hypothetical protein|uniref:Lipoprotein n=1 Tax=Alistipes dispar TaxID=2585119 RepID=A0A4Y1WYM9_9BACT|nr:MULTISPECIES: hypothetical protein [Alistipes]MBS5643163.1 hypothetical protein [Alistipes sp.]HJC19704.1 hypothetical protein [Candidatus Alistipes stercoripullorum]MBQ4903224.1 hypothetical protein [Alistipes sp. Marseille-P2263]MCI2258978.1 hypothetical protein [Alistipes dispar]BBL06077.1 hypothetical protein A5CPEGH6_07150 [Alistipes dispar]
MKLRRYFAVLATAALTAFAAGSCAEPEDEFLHTDSRLLSIEVQPAGGGAGIAGVIDETTGEVYFPIPKKEREKYDITSLMVRAEVEYDTFITPSLTGLKDLSDRDNPFTITLTAGDKGTRTYTLWAFYTRR